MHNAGACCVHDLPNELLSRIFQECLDLQDVDSTPDKLEISYKALVTLCSINRRMRMLAINSPQLWTYFQISPHFDYPPIPFIKLYIERSGTTAPIYLDYFGPNGVSTGHPDGDDLRAPETINLLRPHLHRWKFFRAFFQDPSASAFLNLPLENAISLERIEISSSCVQHLNYAILAKIAKLPALRRLTWIEYHFRDGIDHIDPSFRPTTSDFPWRHLRWLDLTIAPSPDVALQMLSSLTSAEQVSLRLHRPPLTRLESAPPTLIRLPKLRQLDIISDLGMYEIVQYLDLPGIIEMHIVRTERYTSDVQIVPFLGYKDFILRASASLEKGHFDAFGYHGDDILGLLRHPELLRVPKLTFGISGALETLERTLKLMMNKRLDLKRYMTVEHAWWRDGDAHYIGWSDKEILPRASPFNITYD